MSVPSGVIRADRGKALQSLLAPIAAELDEVEVVFARELGHRHAFVQALVDRCSDYRGKRLRPALLLLSGQACGLLSPAHPVLGAVVEMIHTATLVHDDVLDEAVIRRHAPTINHEWNNEAAVLLGDYLFSHAYHLAASLDSTLACRWIGRATNQVCAGELQQIHHRGNLDLDEATYVEIIRGKTAELIAVSCLLGAHYAGANVEQTRSMEAFGRDLGAAFQIADDLLDIGGDESKTGKTLGTDFDKQKLTLPVIHLLATGSAKMAARIRAQLLGPHPDRGQLREWLESSGAIDYAWAKAAEFASSAERHLQRLEPTPAQCALRAMTRYVVERDE